MAKDLLSRIQSWRNQDCGNCRQTMIELLVEAEDTLLSGAILGKAVAHYDAADEAGKKRIQEAVMVSALSFGRKFNG